MRLGGSCRGRGLGALFGRLDGGSVRTSRGIDIHRMIESMNYLVLSPYVASLIPSLGELCVIDQAQTVCTHGSS